MSEEPDLNPFEESQDQEMEHVNGWRAFAALGQFLKDDEWYPQQLEDKTIYRVFFNGKNGDLRCFAQIRIELEQFLFYVMAPTKVPAEKRADIAEYITRANYGLRIGNFEMDYNDGEVRYKSSIDFEDIDLDDALIKHAIYPAVQTMDRYLPGLMSVMYGSTNPEEAILEIEGD